MRFSLFLAAALVAITSNAIDLESQAQETDWNKKVTPISDDSTFLWVEDPKGSGKWRKREQPKSAAKPLAAHPSHV